jgi:hypothetical protein
MKLMKLALVFCIVVLTFSSCERTFRRKIHNREIRAELDKFSDILNIVNSRIYLEGGSYYFFSSSKPTILLSLYLKPNNNNSEKIIAIRDDLIVFFENN